MCKESKKEQEITNEILTRYEFTILQREIHRIEYNHQA
jgi:hypothetical protein